MNDLLTELLDRERIRDCMMRYAQAIDRLDVDLLKAVYWPDAHDWHGPFKGNAHVVCEQIVPFLRENTLHTQHLLGGSLIRLVDGEHAHVETYFQTFHAVRNGDDSAFDMIQGGRYLDKLEKRGHEWGIIDRIVVTDWVKQSPDTHDFAAGVLGSTEVPIGARRPDDLMYGFLGDVAGLPPFDGRAEPNR